METTTIQEPKPTETNQPLQVSDFVTIEKKDGIATLWLDQKNSPVNKISPDVISLFHGLMDEIENDVEIKAGVIISRKKDFIAGADIEMFQKVKQRGDFAPITRKGHEILGRMEQSKKPVVAAIHGTCFGAGLEICLACHARVCSDDKSTKMALPEVKLGLLPGGGGTQRLPRLVGLQKALDMMLTGKNIYAWPAKKMGLVDEVTNKNKLHSVAVQMAKRLAKKPMHRKRKKTLVNWFLDETSIGRSIVFRQARKMAARMTQGNYPAVPEIINCAEIGLKKGMKAGLEEEATRFEGLVLSPQSRGLISLFFAMTDNKKNPLKEQVRKVKTIGILGAGFMGSGVTEVSVNNDFDILLKDINEETIQSARKQIWKNISKKLRRRIISQLDAEQTINRIKGQLDYSDFEHADLVIEAAIEKLDLKRKILAEIEAIGRDDLIFASNTSALPLAQIAKEAQHPELVIGMHYFSPVPKMPLLEIVVTDQTADWVIATCYDVGVRQGKTCVVVKDSPGFYVNRILAPYLNETLLMIEEGVAIEELDKQMKKKGMPVGPVALMDEVGIDVGAHVMSGDLLEYAKQREGAKISMGVINMYEAGLLGKKTKKGFYAYDAKKGKKTGANPEAYKILKAAPRKEIAPEELQDRALFLLLNEAVLCLEEGIIKNPTDGDVGAVFGIGFLPFTGGPFRFIDTYRADKLVARLKELQGKFGDRFKPAPMLVEYAGGRKLFHAED